MFKVRKPYIAALHDVIMAAASFILSLYLRLGENFDSAQSFLLPATIIFTAVCAIVFFFMRLYRGMWRYASAKDLINLTKAVTLAVLIFLPVMFMFNRLEGMPRSAVVINWFVLLALLGGPRFLYRMIKDRTLHIDFSSLPDTRKIYILLLGANDHTEMFLRESMRGTSEYKVVGVLDNDSRKTGSYIHNVRIHGKFDDMEKVVHKLRRKGVAAQKIVFAPGYVDGQMVRKIIQEADRLGLTAARLPRLTEFRTTIEEKTELRPIAIEDLLGRPQTALDRESMQRLVHGKCVAITGAGGTIGGELSRQISGFSPKRLILMDSAEHNLYEIDKEISEKYPHLEKKPLLCNVRNRDLVETIFREEKPDIVFHAAALKHVPLSESNVEEAVLTNVFGTKSVADAAVSCGLKTMVMISTDKAVNPTNVMGTSKRIAESYIQALGQDKKHGNTQFITVRFGNVLGSSGSVIPLFKRQLEQGGPLTVTHPEIKRYFMTVREAVELVLQASAIGSNTTENTGSLIYVLDMGEPVLIKDLAEQMVRLAGLRPHTDIAIEYTGMRPGEKLDEELFYSSETALKTGHDGILLANSRPVDLSRLNRLLKKLSAAASAHHKETTLALLKEIIPEYQPSDIA